MAATFAWHEDYGTQTGSPLGGTSDWTPATNVNWSTNADPSTAYGSNPITAGNTSMGRYQWGHLSGTFNVISAGLWAHTAGTADANLTLNGKVTSSYLTPTTSDIGTPTDMTTVEGIGAGAAVLFSTDANPETATPTASTSGAGPFATQYLLSQLKTGAAAAGDTTSMTLTLQYDEN